MRVCIETDRLIIRNLRPEDSSDAYKWCSDPKVNEFLMYALYDNEEDVVKWIQNKNLDDPNDYDLGFELKETGKVIGCGGLVYHPKEDKWVLGYNLVREHWGKGLVPEALKGIIEEIQKTRKISVLEGVFAKDNPKSGRVMEKLGMSYYSDGSYDKLDGSKHFEAYIYRKVFE